MHEVYRHFTQVNREYNLSALKKLQHLHNILRLDVKGYYLEEVDRYAKSLQQAVSMLEVQNKSPVGQTKVKNYLNYLQVYSSIVKEMEKSTAIYEINKSFIKMSKHATQSHEGDAQKIKFLPNDVFSMPWKNEPISRVATHNLTFQKLYEELEAALQLDKEGTLTNLRD